MGLEDKKALIFVEEMYEEMELHYPRYRLMEAKAKVIVAGPESRKTYKGKHGYPCLSETSVKEIRSDQFDLLIIPGGYAPDRMRRDPKMLEITRQMHEAGKLVAFICHGGWVPISAKILQGVRCTSFFSIKDDMVNAGADWVDQIVVVDKNIISSRCPDDLPQFCQAIINYFG